MNLYTIFPLSLLIVLTNGRNPDGDRLLSYSAIPQYQSIGCFASTTIDIIDFEGKNRRAGELFRTQCTNQPEEYWIVKTEKGITTMRPKLNPTYCLTIDDLGARLVLCNSSDPGSIVSEWPMSDKGSLWYTLGYEELNSSCLDIWTNKTKEYLEYDVKYKAIDKYPSQTSSTWIAGGWMWVSEIEQKAGHLRNVSISFPIRGNSSTNVEKTSMGKDYLFVYIEQMMHSTKPYPKVAFNGSCSCKACNCFPIDYDLSISDIETVEIKLDPSVKSGGASENHPTKNRVSTGMFAIPWVPMEISISHFDTSQLTIIAQLYLHHDGSIDKDAWYRPPGISVKEILRPGLNRIRSPYGGPLTIEVQGRDINSTLITAIISGVPMPNFIIGKTTEKEWADQLQKKPSWITYQGEHLAVLDLKAPFVSASYKQMVSMIKRLDLLMKNHFLISGYDLNPKHIEDVHAVPQGWMWWTRDIKSTTAGARAGNPVTDTAFTDGDIALDFKNWDAWKWGHELGHNMQTSCYSNLFGTEITNNIYSVFTFSYFCGNSSYVTQCGDSSVKDFQAKWVQWVKPALEQGKDYAYMIWTEWAAMTFWLQMIKVYGYDAFRELNRNMREIKVNPNKSKYGDVCGGSDQVKYDTTYEILCAIVKQDLTSHFNSYKIPISTAAKKRVAAKKYSMPSVNITNQILTAGDPMTWKVKGKQPDYALKPFDPTQ